MDVSHLVDVVDVGSSVEEPLDGEVVSPDDEGVEDDPTFHMTLGIQ